MVVVDGDQALNEWVFDFANRDGHRIRIEEIALLKGFRPAMLRDPVANLP